MPQGFSTHLFIDFRRIIVIQNNNSKGISIAALVCGILGIVGSFIPVVQYFTLVLAIVGIVLGAIGMKKAQEANEPKGLALAGLVLGIIGTALEVIGIICVVCIIGAAAGIAGSITY